MTSSSPLDENGTFACPICGRSTPHTHTDDEVATYRSRIEADGTVLAADGKVLYCPCPDCGVARMKKS